MLNHNYIGTEQYPAWPDSEGEGVAAKALESLGIALRASVGRSRRWSAGPAGAERAILFTPRRRRCRSCRCGGAAAGHNYIGTEHILLGLIREGEGVAAQVLVKLGRI